MSTSSAPSTGFNLCPEDELLLCFARTEMSAATRERSQALLRGALDWDKLLQQALRHRVAPLVYPHLVATGRALMPARIVDQLRDHFETNAVRNLQLASHLIHILSLLKAHDLPAIPFKGPVLAASVYRGLDRRESGDLDILVRQPDARRARDILTAHGYGPKAQDGGPWDAIYLRSAYESQLVHVEDRVCIDLHWRLTGNAFPCHLKFEALWPHLQPVPLMGTTVQTLAPHDLLLYLCVHGAKHFWFNLGWVCDVAELLRGKPEIASEALLVRARGLGCERVLSLGLVLAQRVMGVSLPAPLSQHIQADPNVTSLAEQMSEELFQQTYEDVERTEALLLKFKMRERFRDRMQQSLHWLARMILPNQLDRALITLPAACSFLYYGLRPIRLIRTYGITLCRQLARIPEVLVKTIR